MRSICTPPVLRHRLGAVLLLVSLLLRASTTRAQESDAARTRVCRQRLALARTDSARGRLNGLLARYTPTVDSTLYFYQLAVTQLERALPLASGQERQRLLNLASDDYNTLSIFYADYKLKRRQAVAYLRRALPLAQQAGNVSLQVMILGNLGTDYTTLADYAASMQALQQGVRLGQQLPPSQQISVSYCLARLGDLYHSMGEDSTAIRYQRRAVRLLTPAMTTEEKINLIDRLMDLTDTYQEGPRDTAHAGQTARRAWQVLLSLPNPAREQRAIVLHRLGSVYRLEGQWAHARPLLLRAQALARENGSTMVLSLIEANLAMVEAGDQHPALALRYTRQIDAYGARVHLFNRSRVAQLQAQLYEQLGQPREALAAFRRYLVLRDSLTNTALARQVLSQLMRDDFQRRAQVLRATQAAATANLRRQRVLLWATLAGLVLLAVLGYVLWRGSRRRQRANVALSRLNAEVTTQRDQTTQALTELRQTQQQLIQKEKMASLGELTAGIAHEIQNPLNFVNNFSDVSAELVTELDEALAADDKEEAIALATDLRQNLQKIHQHGQRAISIVRGMLEHSRASTGERQPTDVNALADEYLRLAYQGLRAKAQSFNVELQTDLAPNLPLVEAVPGDLGRVLLNLFTNACYAVEQRQWTAEPGYVPLVGVRTRQVGQQVEVRVQDNDTGLSPQVQAKVFQPFFTTKPTGEGTGLGLSLSYDIITKGHSGTLTVESTLGQGSTFTITLPLGTSL